MNKRFYIFLLFFIIIICLGLNSIYFNSVKEGIKNMDKQYINIFKQPIDSSGNYYLPNGYYSINNNYMALIPPFYTITDDSTGIYSNNPNDLLDITDNIPQGYYQVNINYNISPNNTQI